MRTELFLNTVQSTQTASLEWSADGLSVINLTPYPVLVRRGGTDIPTLQNYDFIIPAGGATTLSVTGNAFAFKLQLPVQLPTNANELKAQIILLTCNEVIPAFGTQYFTIRAQNTFNLLANQTYELIIETFTTRYLAINVTHNNAAGISSQFPIAGILKIEQSYDGVSYSPHKIRNMWGNDTGNKSAQEIMSVPARFVKLTISAYANVAGTISYSLLDQSDQLSLSPYTYTIARQGTLSGLQSVVIADRDLVGRLEFVEVTIAAGTLTLGKICLEIAINIDGAEKVVYVCGAYDFSPSSLNWYHTPIPLTFFESTAPDNMFIWHIPVGLSFQRHLKIEILEKANVTIDPDTSFIFMDYA